VNVPFSNTHSQPLSSATVPAIAAISRQTLERRLMPAYSAAPISISAVQVSSPAGNPSVRSAPSTSASRSSAGNRSSSPVTSSTDW
jgi:hypothetical protein